jgi:hypothetical protein
MVLITQDVGQHRKGAFFLDQPHGDTGHRPLQGRAGIHQCQA